MSALFARLIYVPRNILSCALAMGIMHLETLHVKTLVKHVFQFGETRLHKNYLDFRYHCQATTLVIITGQSRYNMLYCLLSVISVSLGT